MADSELKDTLLLMVREHGFEQVQQYLSEIGLSEHSLNGHDQRTEPADGVAVKPSRKRRPKPTASQYVAKMEIAPENESPVSELAGRFDAKSFLPSFGDVIDFCQCYGMDEPASRSRANAIPRVFKLIVSLEAHEIRGIIEQGLFSGPSRLGPIADAIRRNGRAVAATKAEHSLSSRPLADGMDAPYDLMHDRAAEEVAPEHSPSG